jgi:hypothetical protein
MWNGVLQQTTLLPQHAVHSQKNLLRRVGESGTPVGFALHLQNAMGDSQKKWRWMYCSAVACQIAINLPVCGQSMLRQGGLHLASIYGIEQCSTNLELQITR